MMKTKTLFLPHRLSFAVASLVLLTAMPLCAQNGLGSPSSAKAPIASPVPVQTPITSTVPQQAIALQIKPVNPSVPSVSAANHALASFHLALATIYVDQAETQGRQDLATLAIEEYKLALNADPNSPQLNDGLADLYFRIGRIPEAEGTARGLLKSAPDDLAAHKLLGKLYLRQLSEGQNSVLTS